MKYLKEILLVFVILTAMTGVLAAGANIDVSIAKYEPYPAEPGRYIDVWVKVENLGTSQADDVTVRLDPKYPFETVSGEPISTNVGSMLAGATQLIKYKVRVASDAVQGVNSLRIYFKYNGFEESSKDVSISVQTSNAVLDITNIYKEAQIKPGDSSVVSIEMENKADSFFKDIVVKLKINDAAIPFVPKTSAENRIYTIQPGQKINASFEIIALPDAESGIYKVPAEISYSDSVGNQYTIDEVVGLKIGAKPRVEMLIEKDSVVIGKESPLSLKIVNLGLINLKFVKVTMEDSSDYRITSTKEVYVGTLDSDDTSSIDLKIIPHKASFTVKATATYMDVNNNEYTQSFDVPVSAMSSFSIWSIVQTVVVLALLGGAGFLLYKKFVKRKA